MTVKFRSYLKQLFLQTYLKATISLLRNDLFLCFISMANQAVKLILKYCRQVESMDDDDCALELAPTYDLL